MKLENKILWLAVIVAVVWHWFAPYDSTDDTIDNERSGMNIYIDYGTGCQYLGSWFKGLTPRLSTEGKPVCDVEAIRRKR